VLPFAFVKRVGGTKRQKGHAPNGGQLRQRDGKLTKKTKRGKFFLNPCWVLIFFKLVLKKQELF
jgi:hypothetical protein